MTVEQLESKKLGNIATAKELAASGGDLVQAKALMSEVQDIDARIEAVIP